MDENIPVTPIPGPCGVVSALSASGLATNEFTFVGFLPRHGPSRKERLMMASANEARTQIFYVLPHKFSQFLKEFSSLFGVSSCGGALWWRQKNQQPKEEMTLLIEGRTNCSVETPSEVQLEHELRELISCGHTLSTVMAYLIRDAMHQCCINSFPAQMLLKLTTWNPVSFDVLKLDELLNCDWFLLGQNIVAS
ncbi:hypothetical protein BDE02_02G028700 [Populus trichocarpa]|nr:hypothetical protein BDE02_02G028700 [Populus trichocarpa]KAI5596843.1 hypothetical protein BDE02_02G028700 [Populus trichocarpa]KAI5596850.1 hypothetical protein BDE02_02G028700 [Populus trichocarpa]KAI5596851.1 hypothetical protein BDE02_02G028700 [Populus trichocarpa]